MRDYPGMGSGPGNPLPSGDPILPDSLISPAVAQQVRALLGTEQMRMLASQETQAKFESVVEKMLTSMVVKSLEDMDKTPSGHARLAQLATTMAAKDAALGTPAAAVLGATGPGGSGQTTPQPLPNVQTYGQTVRAAYAEGRNVHMSTLAHRAAGAVGSYISQRSPNWQVDPQTGDLVQYSGQMDPGAPGYDPSDPTSGGQEVRRVRADDPNYARTLRHVSMAQSAAAGLTSAAEGGSVLTGRLGMLAGRAAGVAGIGIGVVQAGAHFLEGQQSAAAPYRAAFGGEGTGMFAARERFGEFMAGLSGFGTIGGERAREDYRMASQLGLRGDARGAATDFSRDMFMRYGMTSGDAFGIVRQALEQGNISLSDYAESIRKVTKAAVDGGRNASEAIKDLVATQGVLAQRLSSGTASLGTATNLQTAVSGMDRETATNFGGAEGLAGMVTNQRSIMFAASLGGQNPMEALLASQAPGTEGIRAASNVLNASVDYLVRQIATMAGVSPEQIKSDCAGVNARDEQWDILTNRWAKGNGTLAELMLQRMMIVLPMLGFQQPDSAPAALAMFFSAAGGGLTKGQDLTGGIATEDRVTGHTGFSNYGHDKVRLDYKKGPGGFETGAFGTYSENKRAFMAGGGTMGEGSDEYLKMIGRTGVGSASIEALFGRDVRKDLSEFTGGDADDTKYIVKDKGGKKKTVSLSEIIANPDYRSQLSAGDVLVKGRGHEQASISQFTKIDTEGDATASGGGGKGGGSQKVTIAFTGVAERLLRVVGPTDAERAGVPDRDTYDPDRVPTYGGQ